jgi:aryl-alcohol dehydrogenase-like predicted oxidoreductase
MADHYGSAELIAGAFRSSSPRGATTQMLTKWVPAPGAVSRQSVREAVERALARLQSERIDLLQFHAWHYPDPSWLDALFWLEELRGDGLIAQLGVTNFDAAHLRVALASGIPLVSNQVSYSLIDQRAAGALTASVPEQYDAKLLAYGTLAGGLPVRTLARRPEPAESPSWRPGRRCKYKRFIDAAGGWDSVFSACWRRRRRGDAPRCDDPGRRRPLHSGSSRGGRRDPRRATGAAGLRPGEPLHLRARALGAG